MRRDVNQGFKRFTKDLGVGGLADALRRRYGGNGGHQRVCTGYRSMGFPQRVDWS